MSDLKLATDWSEWAEDNNLTEAEALPVPVLNVGDLFALLKGVPLDTPITLFDDDANLWWMLKAELRKAYITGQLNLASRDMEDAAELLPVVVLTAESKG
jgi:hypothetical protein